MTDIPVPAGMEDEIESIREMIMEAVADSEELMEKYFGGEEFTQEEIHEV